MHRNYFILELVLITAGTGGEGWGYSEEPTPSPKEGFTVSIFTNHITAHPFFLPSAIAFRSFRLPYMHDIPYSISSFSLSKAGRTSFAENPLYKKLARFPVNPDQRIELIPS